ncbi:MAG: methyltransferase domain-containing protein [Fischerella sp. CENA71]|nr:methyltransferase domain-containing protein [Fischerella sp. CENA71]
MDYICDRWLELERITAISLSSIGDIDDMSLAYKISGWNRRRKWQLFLNAIQPTAETTILDCGFSDKEFSQTDNFLEKNYPYPDQITALSTDKSQEFKARYPQIKTIVYDGKIFPFPDQSFDVCWSNAVLEHVGNQERQILFLKEINRVAKVAFITTPNRYFPIEVHTRTPLLHFLPKTVFDRYLHFTGNAWASGDYMYLLSLRDLHRLLHAAEISQYTIIKNRLLFFVLDFVMIFKTITF